MTLDEIKAAVETGHTVHWSTDIYNVIKDSVGQWLVHCKVNDCYWGLTWQDGTTMNGDEADFYVATEGTGT